MRICYFIDEFEGPNAGTEGQLYSLIQGLVANGHEVVLFVLRGTPYTATVADFPCQIVLLSVGSLVSLATLPTILKLRREIRRIRPDVLHAYFNDSALLVPLLASRRACKIFTSRRDMGYWYTPLRLACLRLVNRNCTAVVCNAKAVAAQTAARERLSFERIVVIHNGIDLSADHLTPAVGATRTEQESSVAFRVCLVANLRPIKKIEDLIQAASIIRRKNLTFTFNYLLVGRPLLSNYENELVILAKSLGVDDIVEFAGESNRPRTLMKDCDLGVLTSESEGLSNTLLEYFAEGLPAVCTRVGGNAEIVQDGVNGFLYAPGDVQALAHSMIKLAADPELHNRMSSAAVARARHFSMERLVDLHEQLYDGSHN